MAQLTKFFALSTCVHCRHAREFLEKNRVPFECVYVDKTEGDERQQLLDEVRQYNPTLSFPILVFSDGVVIVGFKPEDISRELDL